LVIVGQNKEFGIASQQEKQKKHAPESGRKMAQMPAAVAYSATCIFDVSCLPELLAAHCLCRFNNSV